MKLTRKEIERIAADRVMQNYRKRMIRFGIIYAFGLMAICFPISYFGENSIGILIFFLGLVLMVFVNVVITFYKISPKAKKMAVKMFDQMLREENEKSDEMF
jgi:hypothetical protein